MKILYLEWNSYCNEDMKQALCTEGHEVTICAFAEGIRTSKESAEKNIIPFLEKDEYDFVFTFNYMPVVSNICKEYETAYVSWVYDSPYIHVYSYTVLNACNYIFLFDYEVYRELYDAGIRTVYYLPLAVNPNRLASLENTQFLQHKYSADVSFVGSLYNEAKHRLYDKFDTMNEYTKGYLDAIISAQKNVYGYYFLGELLNDTILAELERVYPTDPNATTAMKPKDIYADYVLARRVTALERQEILNLLGTRLQDREIKLYTTDEQVKIAGITNCGWADYGKELPYIFLNSKINLNITLRSIKTGIPLRVFDIMGSGGFVLTNFQEEMLQYFESDVDMVLYNDYEDLIGKVEYYLAHDAQRREIAENGYHNVCTNHTLEKRIREIVEIVKGVDE